MKKFWQLMLVVMFALVLVGCQDPSQKPDEPTHEHKYVDGVCDCGEKDPDWTDPSGECEHEYENGYCVKCFEKDPNWDPETPELPEFKEGESCATNPEHERCGYVDTWEWEYNRLKFDGKQMEIILLSGASEEVDPFNDNYTGERKLEKQKQITMIEQAYKIDIVIRNYPDSAAWGPNRVNWINDNAASGTLLQQGHIFTISSDWVPSLKNGNSIASLENLVKKNGIFSELQYEQSSEKNKQYSVGTQVYGYSAGEVHADYFLYYNQQLVKDYGLEDPATLWNEGRWDWDTFYNYLVSAQEAFDARATEKTYAFGGFVNDIARGMLAGRGHKLIDNEAGTVMFTNPNTIQLYNDLRTIYAAGMWAPETGADVPSNFPKGLQLFTHGQLWFLSSEMRFKGQTGFDIGLVPYPTANGAAQANGAIVDGYLVPMGADSGYAFPIVSNGKNGLTTAVLVNIADDITRGLVPEFNATDMSARDQYIAFLSKRIQGEEAAVDQIIAAIMSVEDNIKTYGYTDYMDIVSKSVGGGSDWNLEGFATWGMALVTNQDVNPQGTLQSKKDIYQDALDEILAA